MTKATVPRLGAEGQHAGALPSRTTPCRLPACSCVSSDFRCAMDLSLVLGHEGIAHELRRVGYEDWAL